MATREEALNWIGRLGLAEVFCRLYAHELVPYHLDIYFGCPEEIFSPHTQQDAYTEGRLVPLVDDGNFGLITFFDPQTGQFLEKDVEAPGEVVESYDNWQQFLAEQIVRIADSGVGDDELRAIAEEVGFRYCSETLGFLNGCGDLPDEEYQQRWRAFRRQLPA